MEHRSPVELAARIARNWEHWRYRLTVDEPVGEAVDGEPAARKFFDGLSYSKKQWFVLRIEQAKKAETRERRVKETVTMLREGRTGN
jgi:uncharacterized protein YdeI (YjbR/CyaY-like superfamily)